MNQLPYDYAVEINRDRRRHAIKKHVARCGLLGFAAIMGLAFGVLCNSLSGDRLFLAALLVVWGVWGVHFLVTRH